MDRGALQATVHGVAKSQTRLSTHLDLSVRNQNTKNTKKIMGEKYFIIKWEKTIKN